MVLKKKVRIGGTVDRTLGFTTPSVADQQCPNFSERFIRFGPSDVHGETAPSAKNVIPDIATINLFITVYQSACGTGMDRTLN